MIKMKFVPACSALRRDVMPVKIVRLSNNFN